MQNTVSTLFIDVMPTVLIGIIVVYATIDTVSDSTFVLAYGGVKDYFAEVWGRGVGERAFCFCFDPGCHSVVESSLEFTV